MKKGRRMRWQEDEEVATLVTSLSLTLSLDPVPFPSSHPYSLPPSWRMKLHVTSSSSFYPSSYMFVLLDLLPHILFPFPSCVCIIMLIAYTFFLSLLLPYSLPFSLP